MTRPSGFSRVGSAQSGEFRAEGGTQGFCRPSALEVVETLGLEPHREGGFFRETYRAAHEVQTAAGMRAVSTAILYLLTVASPSRFHRLASDELWFYHGGDPAELWLFPPAPLPGWTTEGALRGHATGSSLRPKDQDHSPVYATVSLQHPCTLVPAGWWMGARAAGADGGSTATDSGPTPDVDGPGPGGESPAQGDAGPARNAEAQEENGEAQERGERGRGALGWTLVSCVVTPGFEYEDFEQADREALLRAYPAYRDLILGLT